jgi:transketolase
MNTNIQNIINKNLADVKQVAIRVGFGEGLVLAGKYDDRVAALCADLTESTQTHLFKEAYPERFFEMGVAEQNMASVASGMAAMGKIPFITSYAMFSPGRNWEQIRTTIAYNNVPVVVVGHHAGLSVGPDGGTHQALEDISLMRVVPNMTVVVPCDALEAKKATLALAKLGKPSYLRLAREKSPIVTVEEDEFEVGKANVVYESSTSSNFSLQNQITPNPSSNKEGGRKVGIIACGEMVSRALLCVAELEALGFGVGVMNVHTIKPLDKKSIIQFTKKYKNILTAEEHQIYGGLGSAVAEVLTQEASSEFSFKFAQIGVEDQFGQSGKKEELFSFYKINENSVIKKIKEKFL